MSRNPHSIESEATNKYNSNGANDRMDKETTTYGLGMKQLQQLFSLGEDSPEDGTESQAELLVRRLSETLPLGKEQVKLLPEVLAKLCHTMGTLAGETILSLLKNSSTDIEVLKRVKRHAKRLSSHALTEAEHQVAVAMYYGAIASALAFHDQRISRLSYEKLVESFSRLAEEPWMSKDLIVLYRIAKKYCKDKSQ